MERRDFLKELLTGALAGAEAMYAQRTRGMPSLAIRAVKVFALSPGGRGRWVLIKVETSEPGLYGIGSASNFFQPFAVAAAIEKHLAPWWTGKPAGRIEDLWQSTHVRSYWRNSTILNNALSALDVALWDIKGKRAGMPVYDLLGGKARDAVALYAHADGRSPDEVAENVRKYMDEGYRHVRAQMGGYGGGGTIAQGQGRRVEGGYQGPAFDEDQYVDRLSRR